MDTIDRSSSNLPAQFATPLPRPALIPMVPSDLAQTPAIQVNPKVIVRGLTRHWWLILSLWVAVSVPIAYLIYLSIEPTYEAFSTLRFEPTQPELFGILKTGIVEARSVGPYLRTQVNVIKSDRVLKETVAHPSVSGLSMIQQSEDPKTDLRKQMQVEIMDDAYMIRVALESPNAAEAATIVNTVVETYMTQNKEFNRSANATLQASLEGEIKKLSNSIKDKKHELDSLVEKGVVKLSKPQLNPNAFKADGDQTLQSTFEKLTEDQLQRTVIAIAQTDIDLIEVKSLLEVLKREGDQAHEQDRDQQGGRVDEKLEKRIEEEFQKDPEVIGLINEITEVKEHLAHLKELSKLNHDPALVAAQKKLKHLNAEYKVLWDTKYFPIREQLVSVNGDPKGPNAVKELDIKFESLMNRKKSLAEMLEIAKVDDKTTNHETFRRHALGSRAQKPHEPSRSSSEEPRSGQVRGRTGQLSSHTARLSSRSQSCVEQQARQVYGGRAGRYLVYDARAVHAAGNQVRARRRSRCSLDACALRGLRPTTPADESVDVQAGSQGPARAIQSARRPPAVRRLRQLGRAWERQVRADHKRDWERRKNDRGRPACAPLRRGGDVDPFDRCRPAKDGSLQFTRGARRARLERRAPGRVRH